MFLLSKETENDLTHIQIQMNKTVKTIVFITIIIVVLALIKILIFPKEQENKAGKSGKNAKKINNITVYVIKPEVLENNIKASGTIFSDMETQLKPEIAGRIIKINFRDGAQVKKSQLLVKLNDADLQAQLKKLKVMEKLYSEKEIRQNKLLKLGGISIEEYDNTLSQLQTTQAEIELLKVQIDKTEIKAPFEGVIGLRNVDEGQYVTTSNIIASLQKLNTVKIDFSIPEQYAKLISLNEAISFTVKGSAEKFKGEIAAIEPKVDLSTRTVMIRAKSPNAKNKLIPGSFAEVELSLQKTNNALMIPTEAVIPILKGQKVFIYKSGKAKEQKIITGIRTENKIQVTEGIAEGDTIITSGIMQIKDGDEVKIMKDKKSSNSR